jgi:hypothetical protein
MQIYQLGQLRKSEALAEATQRGLMTSSQFTELRQIEDEFAFAEADGLEVS